MTAAEVVAAEILHPIHKAQETNGKPLPKNHPPMMMGTPPPECPMHQKNPPQPAISISECPVKHGESDINPLNMVLFYTILFIINLDFELIVFIVKKFFFVDATCQSTTISGTTL